MARVNLDDPDQAQLAEQRRAIADAAGSVTRLPDGATYVEDLRAADRTREASLVRRPPTT